MKTMVANRYFVEEKFKEGMEITLSDEEVHHLHVLRIREGESLELVNGQLQLAKATLLSLSKKQARVSIDSVYLKEKPKPSITLLQAIPRLNRLDTILEKGCELGMSSISLFPTERSEKKELSSNQLERGKRILISAMKQCGRLDLPTITLLPSLLSWKENDITAPVYFGDLREDAPLFSEKWHYCDSLSFLVGPEGGLTEEEIQHLRQLECVGVRLHPNILRTDTAALAALTLISHFSMHRK